MALVGFAGRRSTAETVVPVTQHTLLVQFQNCRFGKRQLISSLVQILFCMPALSSGVLYALCLPGQTWNRNLAVFSLAVGPWTCHLTSLSLHFLTCKIVIS